MEDSHRDARYEKGDSFDPYPKAPSPSATVLGITEVDGELHYKVEWGNGTVNEQPVEEMDRKTRTPR